MSSSEWQQAIADALGRENPCFMCAETLPWRCHRRLIADLLAARQEGADVALVRRQGGGALQPVVHVAQDGTSAKARWRSFM